MFPPRFARRAVADASRRGRISRFVRFDCASRAPHGRATREEKVERSRGRSDARAPEAAAANARFAKARSRWLPGPVPEIGVESRT